MFLELLIEQIFCHPGSDFCIKLRFLEFLNALRFLDFPNTRNCSLCVPLAFEHCIKVILSFEIIQPKDVSIVTKVFFSKNLQKAHFHQHYKFYWGSNLILQQSLYFTLNGSIASVSQDSFSTVMFSNLIPNRFLNLSSHSEPAWK